MQKYSVPADFPLWKVSMRDFLSADWQRSLRTVGHLSTFFVIFIWNATLVEQGEWTFASDLQLFQFGAEHTVQITVTKFCVYLYFVLNVATSINQPEKKELTAGIPVANYL